MARFAGVRAPAITSLRTGGWIGLGYVCVGESASVQKVIRKPRSGLLGASDRALRSNLRAGSVLASVTRSWAKREVTR